ncbi:MAG TPA: hypothetical protein VGG06_24890 [Thermoanaerobaculia bacterium]|jgi:hypothetical protein
MVPRKSESSPTGDLHERRDPRSGHRVKSLEKRPDLDEDYRSGLKTMIDVLGDWPENAFDELGAFRRSFIAPVPSGLAERIGRPDRLALSGRSGRRRG